MKYILLISSLLVCMTTYNLSAQSIKSSASNVTFEVANMKFRTVEGSVSGMTGNLTFDESNLEVCEFDVCVDATTLNTDNSKRDSHLQQPEFFDTDKHPEICFVSEMVKSSHNGYAVVGQLTMKGVTQSVMIPFTFDGTTFAGDLTLSRADYSIGADTNNFLIGDTIEIRIVCVVE